MGKTDSYLRGSQEELNGAFFRAASSVVNVRTGTDPCEVFLELFPPSLLPWHIKRSLCVLLDVAF